MATVRIFIVDDYEPWRREAVCSILQQCEDLDVICEGSDGLEAVQKSADCNLTWFCWISGFRSLQWSGGCSPHPKGFTRIEDPLLDEMYYSPELLQEALRSKCVGLRCQSRCLAQTFARCKGCHAAISGSSRNLLKFRLAVADLLGIGAFHGLKFCFKSCFGAVYIELCGDREDEPDCRNQGWGTLMPESCRCWLRHQPWQAKQIVGGATKTNSQSTFSSPRSLTWRNGPVCFQPSEALLDQPSAFRLMT